MAKKVTVNFAAKVVTIRGAESITEIRDPLYHVRELVGEEERLTIKGGKFILETGEKVSATKPLDVIKMGLKWFLVELKGKEVYIRPTDVFETTFHLKAA